MDDPEALEVRAIGMKEADRADRADPVHALPYARWLKNDNPAVVANTMLCLIRQANYLLDRLYESLEKDFVENGGYSEKLAATRMAHRQGKLEAGKRDKGTAPVCPQCGKPMALRTARQGAKAGKQFWGCSGYPGCKGAREA